MDELSSFSLFKLHCKSCKILIFSKEKRVICSQCFIETDESQSYERQISDLKKWANYKNLEIVEEFAEKISGFKKGLDCGSSIFPVAQLIEDSRVRNRELWLAFLGPLLVLGVPWGLLGRLSVI